MFIIRRLRNKRLSIFLSKVYGYRAGGGAWPEWNSSDTEAFIKVKKALLELSFNHTVEEEFL